MLGFRQDQPGATMRRRALIAYWLSEAPLVLRAKQILTAVLPAPVRERTRKVFADCCTAAWPWTWARTSEAIPGCSQDWQTK